MTKPSRSMKDVVSRSARILHHEVKDQVLVCLFNKAQSFGGATTFDAKAPDAELLKAFVSEVTDQLKSDTHQIVAKLAGPKWGLVALESLLASYSISVASKVECHETPLEIYFYTDTGRMRVAELQKTQELPRINFDQTAKADPSINAKPIRVLIVDDSATIRKVLRSLLDAKNGFEVVGDLPNAVQAEEFFTKTPVDVITLDINMPEMDGIRFLETLKGKRHPPIVMISAVNAEDANRALQCFELGAVGYIEKPSNLGDQSEGDKIRSILKTAAASTTQALDSLRVTQPILNYQPTMKYRDLILIGASTGGTQAITALLAPFPENSPPILIVQHIPAIFSAAFAERLNAQCKLKVKEAQHGDLIENSTVYIAPGGKQMRLKLDLAELRIEITDDAPVNRHKPSVDYLFNSVLNFPSRYRMVAALLTGMGADGARGLKALKDRGIHTVAESEETCVVFGMPREAIKLGGASEVAPLHKVGQKLFGALNRIK